MNPFEIIAVKSREILDSRGNPTVETVIRSASGASGTAKVPSGASTGKHEAIELRDNDMSRYGGKGVLKAVSNVVDIIAPQIIGKNCNEQEKIDNLMIELDSTQNKSRLGANAILSVSMACCSCASSVEGRPLYRYLSDSDSFILPVPMMNVINGGKHAGNKLSIQEFIIEPYGLSSFREAVRVGSEVYHKLKDVLKEKYGPSSTNVGDEGGYAPPLEMTEDALDSLMLAIKKAGYSESEIALGIDAAASNFYDEKSRVYRIDGRSLHPESLLDFYLKLVDRYPIKTIEDPFHEEAFDDFSAMTSKIGKKVMIIGDDIYVTNKSRIEKGINRKSTNSVLIKLNQIGSVTETKEAISLCRENGLSFVISHRSGETEDTFIAHLAVASGSDFIKAGAPARGERIAKYNELLRIEEELGSKGRYRKLTLV
ncbi:MAG: phosphopyruvate hydratase [Conexivisphaerales archaeon]